jgi:hypothetical protein
MVEEDSTGDKPVTCVSIDPKDTVFLLPAVKAKTLLIDIANGDNAPLVIRKVVSAQSGIYLLAYLLTGEGSRYELGAGDSTEGPPDYDLLPPFSYRKFTYVKKFCRIQKAGIFVPAN